MYYKKILYLALFTILPLFTFAISGTNLNHPEVLNSITVNSNQEMTTLDFIVKSIEQKPFNLFASLIFIFAVLHTFLAGKFNHLAHNAQKAFDKKILKLKQDGKNHHKKDPISFKASILHLLGEVEVIFGIWLLPLFICIGIFYGWKGLTSYVDYLTFSAHKYTEPIFVIVIMSMSATKPVINLASRFIGKIASFGKETPFSWWFSILFTAPILGSFITEPAAMTIAALLLAERFYSLNPSTKLKYATLGLLFVNTSVGGVLTHFAAPPVLMIASVWNYDTPFMFINFGWKSIIGILLANIVYYLLFAKEFKKLKEQAKCEQKQVETELNPPILLTLVHILFMVLAVISLHHPAMLILIFMAFIAFVEATKHNQYDFSIKSPMLVGFFLASLVTHGTLQTWWIEPILTSLGNYELYFGSMLLTAFNDNAAITYLASQVSGFTPQMKYYVVAGAVIGGGLTVIANAPNPAGQAILSKFFGGTISPLKLLLSALIPTAILATIYLILPSFS